jgi:hypothetical protein
MRDPYSPLAGAAPRLAVAALLVAAVWAVSLWAMAAAP